MTVTITSRHDAWCAMCRWKRPSFVSRDRGGDLAAYRAFVDDVISRISDHVGGMEHEVRHHHRTFHDDLTEESIYRYLPSMRVQTVNRISGPVPPGDREVHP